MKFKCPNCKTDLVVQQQDGIIVVRTADEEIKDTRYDRTLRYDSYGREIKFPSSVNWRLEQYMKKKGIAKVKGALSTFVVQAVIEKLDREAVYDKIAGGKNEKTNAS